MTSAGPVAAPSLAERAGSTAVTALAVYGRFRMAIGAAVGVIVAAVLILAGVAKLRDPHTGAAAATVVGVTGCASSPGCAGNAGASCAGGVACTTTVRFPAKGVVYTVPGVQTHTASPLAVGGTVNLRYNPANPTQVVQEVDPRKLGWGLIAGGSLLALAAGALTYVTFKSKSIAAIEGASSLVRAL